MGRNGHIGFNEPGVEFERKAHCINLSNSTIEVNSRFFSNMDEVPKQAYTMGIMNIMQAKKILVLVNGIEKADIVKKAFRGEVTPQIPASILQLHNDLTIIGDEEALSRL
jgi:glucosamine-6-phosphate deaminase